MAQPTPANVRYDPILTNIVREYRLQQGHYVATGVFPLLDSGGKSGLYQVIPRGGFVRDEKLERAPSTESKGGGFKFETDTYNTKRYAFHKDLDDEVIAAANLPVGPEEAASRYVSSILMTNRERRFYSNMMKSGIWSEDITPTTKWDAATSDPRAAIRTAKTKMLKVTGFVANTLTMGWDVFQALQEHPDLKARLINVTSTVGFPGEAIVAQWLDVERIVVSRASYNVSAEGVADSFSFSFGDNVLLCYTPAGGEAADGIPAAGYTFNWNEIAPFEDVPTVNRFYMEEITSYRIESEMYYEFVVVAKDLGMTFQDVLA